MATGKFLVGHSPDSITRLMISEDGGELWVRVHGCEVKWSDNHIHLTPGDTAAAWYTVISRVDVDALRFRTDGQTFVPSGRAKSNELYFGGVWQ